ncbi:MAG: RsmB/NOP family class I SAM-dependent RNA methyltransferase [Albidovulum sp.]|nr:RsmB/NOP family class I SAM-dependent RNA methyltransferase [Albidovulum sp.]
MKSRKRFKAKTGFADKSPSAERRLAADLLDGVILDGIPLNVLAGNPNFANAPPHEGAAAMRLVKDALRNLNRIDSVLDAFIKNPLRGRPKNSLRISVAEVFCQDSSPYAAVDQGVRLMRERSGSGNLAGLANAVLRKAAIDGKSHWDSASGNKLPKWISEPVRAQFGEPVLNGIEIAHEKDAPLDLTPANRNAAKALAGRLHGELLPTGSIRLQGKPKVSGLPGYCDGTWWVQDMSAAIPARMLGDVSGLRILDMCAAPGGKTMQLAAAGANVTSCDISGKRIERLRANLERTRLHAEIVEMDALEWNRNEFFDAVIVDPPCTATGTIRRNPDIPFVGSGERLGELVRLQDQLLEKAFELLKPGGVIVYSTCSILFEEGESRADRIVSNRKLSTFAIDPEQLGLDRGWESCNGGIRLRPDYWAEIGGMDGFFSIMLKRA